MLPKKGAYPEGIRRLGEELDKLGHRRMAVKSDQEPAILKLIEATLRERHQDITTEQSPVGEHAANGVAERASKPWGGRGDGRGVTDFLGELVREGLEGGEVDLQLVVGRGQRLDSPHGKALSQSRGQWIDRAKAALLPC